MRFYTGMKWGQLRKFNGPACVCLSSAPKYRYPAFKHAIALDDGFNRLAKSGHWDRTIDQHEKIVRAAVLGFGRIWVEWSSSMDWMCEKSIRCGAVRRRGNSKGKPKIDLIAWKTWAREAGPEMAETLAKAEEFGDDCEVVVHGTGLDILEHQFRTIANYIALCNAAPDLPWLPVLQGDKVEDYLRCVELYHRLGVNLWECERVGVGSVCSRSGTWEAVEIALTLIRLGLRVHLYGIKLECLRELRRILSDEEWSRVSADSAAWSKHAWKGQILMPGHYHGEKTKNCANCPEYAALRTREMMAMIYGTSLSPRRRERSRLSRHHRVSP